LTLRYVGSQPVRYSYIIFQAFNNTYRAFSDIFILWGLYLVLKRFHRPDVTLGASWFAFLLLWVLCLYQIFLEFALCFVWLSFANLDTIEAVANSRACVEIASVSAKFACALLLACYEEPKKSLKHLPMSAMTPLKVVNTGLSTVSIWIDD